ncbi:MAG: hypothetical protein AAGD18_23195 [Actinomycetota bacterium]
MSLRRRILARLAAAVVALTVGAGTFGAASAPSDVPNQSEEAGATWSRSIDNDDRGDGWLRFSRGATWS